MLKIHPHYFGSVDQWTQNRNRTFFASMDEVNAYQKWRLKFLSLHYGVDPLSVVPTTNIPQSVDLNAERKFRSGTTSVVSNREYYYSYAESDFVDRHHIWKIERSHKLEDPGVVIWICSKDYELSGGSKVKRIFGPQQYRALGDNVVYELFYNHNFGIDEWFYNLQLMKTDFDVKFVRTSPSVIETMYYYFGDTIKFDFPVVLSEETLNDNVRQMAGSIFNRVIDKMVCWDGCLGWFECPYGVKHIYDEFCFVEDLGNGVLASTDLNNLASPFMRYVSGDHGKIGQIDCQCGLSGNYFKQFDGKIIESLYVENEGGKLIPGRFVSEKLSVLFRTGHEFQDDQCVTFDSSFIYKIRQGVDLSVEFMYGSKSELNELQKDKIVMLLNKVIWQNKNCKPIVFSRIGIGELMGKETRRSKSLFIESDYVRAMRNQKRVRDDGSRLI